ncbi:hypothetical protein K504DRAFT_467739 [Pleomassaria siparia CBS 279.74]|uniref:Uncharacterized protein n=1 Tax=Pleomassaria siparia CBS 279.74 TaxID=1314801 RepID=A0A6G1KAK5_9PLEO|nr:hypothetical protein K504DRAFT_467739 [Pleomassaria siparia CBS 279.74]
MSAMKCEDDGRYELGKRESRKKNKDGWRKEEHLVVFKATRRPSRHRLQDDGPLQAIAGHCRSLQVVAGHCRSLQVVAGRCRSLQVVAGRCRRGRKVSASNWERDTPWQSHIYTRKKAVCDRKLRCNASGCLGTA